MKTYGELAIELRGVTPEQFGDAAEAAASGGWARDRSKDDEMRRGGGGDPWFTFTLTGHSTLPTTFVFVTQRHKTSSALYVPNAISPARDHLTYDEYNQLLASFADGVLAPLKAAGKIDFALFGSDIDLTRQLPQAVYDRLRRFSVAANKRTGSSHPLDQERWMDFLIAVDDARIRLDSQTLARWLVESEGWDADQASRLAEEYEFGRELLQRRRAS